MEQHSMDQSMEQLHHTGLKDADRSRTSPYDHHIMETPSETHTTCQSHLETDVSQRLISPYHQQHVLENAEVERPPCHDHQNVLTPPTYNISASFGRSYHDMFSKNHVDINPAELPSLAYDMSHADPSKTDTKLYSTDDKETLDMDDQLDIRHLTSSSGKLFPGKIFHSSSFLDADHKMSHIPFKGTSNEDENAKENEEMRNSTPVSDDRRKEDLKVCMPSKPRKIFSWILPENYWAE